MRQNAGKPKTCVVELCDNFTGLDPWGFCSFHAKQNERIGVVHPPLLNTRKNAGKPKLGMCLLMPEALTSLETVMLYGEEKYTPAAEKGWMKYHKDEVIDSMLRHTMAMANGEYLDQESGLPHVNHMLFNAAVLVELSACCSSSDSLVGILRPDLNEN